MILAAALLATITSLPDAALYRGGDHLYSLARTDGEALLLLEYDSGRLWRLHIDGAQYAGGPSIGVETPVAVRVAIGASTIRIDREGRTITAAQIRPFTMEPVIVRNGDEKLAGTLYAPQAPGRHAAIVTVPGAADATRRSMALPAPYFARRGIAVLALDKRADWRTATFEDLASDVLAAVEALRMRRDIDPKRIGIYASSQGGWIAPIAAARSPQVAFIVCAACPATGLTAQELIRTAAELRADGFAPAEVDAAVAYRRLFFDYLRTGAHRAELEAADQRARSARWYPRFGGVIDRDSPLARWWQTNERYVPTEFWSKVNAPALLLFAALDTRVPPSEHATKISAADPSAKVIVVPNVDHEGFIARTGGRDEVPLLDRLPPRPFETAIDWILARR